MYHLQASAYAKCVAVKEDVTKDVCVKEFMALKECFTIAVSIKFIRLLLAHFNMDYSGLRICLNTYRFIAYSDTA